MNRQLNQVDMPKQTIKNSDFQQSSFFNIGRKFKLARKTCSKATFIFMDEIFDYFSTETGKRLGYKILNVKKLKEELGISKSSLYRAIQEVNEKEIFIVLPTSENKFILYFINEQSLEIKRQVETGELIVSLDTPKPKFSKTNITTLPGKIVVSNLEKEVPENKNTFPKITNIESNMKQAFPNMIQVVPNLGKVNIDKTIVNSEVETLSKNVQESLSKESLLKNPSLDLLGSSKEKNNFTANLFQDLEKIDWVFRNELKEEKKIEVKIAYEKKETIEPKKVFSENKQEQVKNDFPELQQEKKRASEAIKDLTDAEREVQAFLTKDLEILNQDLFFSFVRKLPNDMILSKARYVLEKVSAGKVTSPEGFLRAILSKELAKNETSGNVDVTGKVKQNDYEKAILFCSEIPSSLPQYKFVTNAVSKNFATNIENNKKRIAGELYRCYCFGLLENRQEYKEKLDLIMSGLPKYLHIQDFKDILECDTALDKAKKDRLIEMFRENM